MIKSALKIRNLEILFMASGQNLKGFISVGTTAHRRRKRGGGLHP